MTAREKASILVVEDEAKMRRLLELQLGEEGFLVHSAADAEAGLQLLVREKPDLVVTDLRLPGMSGLEFLQAVKRANAATARRGDDRVRHGGIGRGSDEGRRERLRDEAVFALTSWCS